MTHITQQQLESHPCGGSVYLSGDAHTRSMIEVIKQEGFHV